MIPQVDTSCVPNCPLEIVLILTLTDQDYVTVEMITFLIVFLRRQNIKNLNFFLFKK